MSKIYFQQTFLCILALLIKYLLVIVNKPMILKMKTYISVDNCGVIIITHIKLLKII